MRTETKTMGRATVYGAGRLDPDALASVARMAGGFTVTRTEGGWTAPDGSLVTEPGWKVEVMAPDRLTAECAAAWLVGWTIGMGQCEVWTVLDSVRVEVTRAG